MMSITDAITEAAAAWGASEVAKMASESSERAWGSADHVTLTVPLPSLLPMHHHYNRKKKLPVKISMFLLPSHIFSVPKHGHNSSR